MRIVTIVIGVAVLAACGGGAPSDSGGGAPAATVAPAAPAASVASTTPRTYDIRGRIDAIGAERKSVTLDHEKVADVMPAMKMEYKVSDAAVLEGLAVGDQVQGQLEARPAGEYVVVRLRK